MNGIYQVTVRGRKLESRDLRKLLARAVVEKRNMDQRLRLFSPLQGGSMRETGSALSGNMCPANSTSH
jgi:hypothetical protein